MNDSKDKKTDSVKKTPTTAKKLDSTSKMVSKTTSRIVKITQPPPEEQAKIEKQKKFFFKIKYFMFISIPFLLIILILIIVFKPFRSKTSTSGNNKQIVIKELEDIKDLPYEQKKYIIKGWSYKTYSDISNKLDKARYANQNVYVDIYKIILEFKNISESDLADIEKVHSYVNEAIKIYDGHGGVNLPPKYYELLQNAKNLCEKIFIKYPAEWGPPEIQSLKKFKHSEIDPRLE